MDAETQLHTIRQRIYRIPIDLKFTSKVKAVVDSEMKRARRSLPRSEYLRLRDLLRQELHALVTALKAEALAKIPSLLKDPDRFMARIVSQDLRRFTKLIRLAAEQGRKRFFIALGKSLSRKNAEVWDRRNVNLAAIYFASSSVTDSYLINEMKKLGWHYNEEKDKEAAMRMQRLRMRRGIDAAGKALRDVAKPYARIAKT